MQPDAYVPAHKGLRAALSNLQYLAGRSDFTDDTSLNRLHDEMIQLWDVLDFHAEGEDEFIHPSLEKADKTFHDNLEAEHHELTKVEKNVLANLKSIMDLPVEDRTIAGKKHCQELNDYIARYFTHLQREELEAMPRLRKVMSDSEILKIPGKFSAKASPEVMQYLLKFMIPAMNHGERVGMFSGMKAGMPEQAFQGVVKLAQSVLEESEFNALSNGLNM